MPSTPAPTPDGVAVRVLVIEDEVRLAEHLRRGLDGEGFRTQVRHTGTAGLQAALEDPYDVVVCDIMLPGLSGYDVVRRLRAVGAWTPVLMLTAKDGEYDQADAFELGADDYLTKPFSLVVLVARLRALVRRSGLDRPRTLTAGDLRLDPTSRQVFRGRTEIGLTAREFQVLEFLLSHPGQVLSKKELLETVWEAHSDGDPNLVEVYIGYLRRKVDTPFGRQAIATVRGVGYRLDPSGG